MRYTPLLHIIDISTNGVVTLTPDRTNVCTLYICVITLLRNTSDEFIVSYTDSNDSLASDSLKSLTRNIHDVQRNSLGHSSSGNFDR